jgi:hypothetical protein
MRHSFRAYTFHMRYACEACRFRIVLFGQPWSARESVLMMRGIVRIRSKFRWHNPDVFRCTISDVQSVNSGVMLPKFCPDPNQASYHKHTLSINLGWV